MAVVMSAFARRQLLRLPIVALVICGCSVHPDSDAITSRAAIKRAQVAAVAAGYDLVAFNRDWLARARDTPDDRWVIHYTCKDERPAPGCGFVVTVDTRTGASDVYGDE